MGLLAGAKFENVNICRTNVQQPLSLATRAMYALHVKQGQLLCLLHPVPVDECAALSFGLGPGRL
jgi:hypothetical protein